MRNIFSYDSTLMRFLTRLFDIISLSFIFILCSIPILTVGAAQAALASAVRSMLDPHAEQTPLRAFFKGFSAGFGKITVIWLCCMIPICCSLYVILGTTVTDFVIPTEVFLMLAVITVLCMMFQVMSSFLHSRFDCKLFDLIKNSLLLVVTYPIRTLIMGILVWTPLCFALLEPYVFLAFSPFFIFFYFGLAFMLCYSLIKKPFRKIQEQYFPDD